MAIEVAGGISAAVGFVVRGLDDFRAGRLRAGIVRIDIVQVYEHSHRRRARLARADHAPLLCALSHHDALAIERHLAVHAATRRTGTHLFRETKRARQPDRKSTRLNSSHPSISYAVFCLKKKKKK